MHARHAAGRACGGVGRADPLQQRRVGLSARRWRPPEPSVVTRRRYPEHTRHGGDREAGPRLRRGRLWCALMNPKTRTADGRSRAPTRPPLLRGLSRDAEQGAPAGAAAPRGADRPARQHRRVPKPSPPGRPSCHRHARPNCGSTARSARTRRRDRRDHARCEPDRPSDGETPALMGPVSWPSDHLLRKRGGVHESGSTPVAAGIGVRS